MSTNEQSEHSDQEGEVDQNMLFDDKWVKWGPERSKNI